MERHRRMRRSSVLITGGAALAVCALMPSLASGQNVVTDAVDGLGLGDGGGVQQQQEEQPAYQPPLHGDNPHGQGTAATVDIAPSRDLPYSGDPDGFEGDDPMGSEEDVMNGEEVVVGRSRGEQNNPYHGHVTILALFGEEIAGIDTSEGESEEFGPLSPLLTPICEESGGALCLGVLSASSETGSTGSENHFEFVGLNSQSELGSLQASALSSNGNIEEDSSCQRAHGDSQVAGFFAGRDSQSLSLGVLGSSADSEACNDGTSSQSNDSYLFRINEEGVLPFCEGEELHSILFLLAVACNADDTNGVGEAVQQAPVPYGVREAASVFVLPFFLFPEEFSPDETPLALLKLTAAASESHAVAPPAAAGSTPPTTPSAPATTDGSGGNGGNGGGGDKGGDGGEGAGPAAGAAQAGGDDLAFTGADMLVLGLIGAALILGGLGLARASGRHSRATA